MSRVPGCRSLPVFAFVVSAVMAPTVPAVAQPAPGSPDARAAELEARMTDEERVRLLHSTFARPDRTSKPLPEGAIASASYTPGNPRLGIPALHETDASLGVASVNGLRHDGATALPSSLSLASTWDREVARRGSALIAKEARAKGFNVLLAGGVNLAREPRNGRNFEYLGEDPLLSGTLAGETVRAIQAAHMISTVKHFAVNPQETGRHVANSVLSDAAAHDSDLLAFRIAIDIGQPGAVMCAYNLYNGPHACQSSYLLNETLKREWRYPGFVMSDWGAVRDVRDLLAGLDRQSGEELDDRFYFADDLLAAARNDKALHARLHLHRETGGRVEVLMLREQASSTTWEALVRPGGKIRAGEVLSDTAGRAILSMVGRAPDGDTFLVEPLVADIAATMREIGEAPLPPYITERLADATRYQTVYAHEERSAAAPTAGLHFTPELLTSIRERGVRIEEVETFGLDIGRVLVQRADERIERGGGVVDSVDVGLVGHSAHLVQRTQSAPSGREQDHGVVGFGVEPGGCRGVMVPGDAHRRGVLVGAAGRDGGKCGGRSDEGASSCGGPHSSPPTWRCAAMPRPHRSGCCDGTASRPSR